MFRLTAVMAVTCAAGSALAGSFSTSVNVSAFGANRTLSIYRVATDLPAPSVRLEPEGMTWFNGDLYVSGDGGAVATPSETNGFIARYIGGNLASAPVPIGQFAEAGRAFGPEGITVNTRGVGYGSFNPSVQTLPNLVALDSAGGSLGRVITTLNTSNVTVSGTVTAFPINSDDIAFVPGATAAQDRFAIIDGTGGANQMRFVSASNGTTELVGSSFALPNQSKGLLYLSPTDATWFSTDARLSGGGFLVAISPEFASDPNLLNLYSLTGELISSTSLGIAGTGVGLLGNVESLAWDSATQRLFIGDENGTSSQIAVITIPTPTVASLLGLGALVTARRRR